MFTVARRHVTGERERRHGHTALHKAAWHGRSHSVKLLLQHGALVDAECKHGGRPLHYACAHGHVACLHELMKHGADFEARQNRWGLTTLQMAAYFDRANCVTALLGYGANTNVTDPLNHTALFHVVIMSHVDVIATLLAYAQCDVPVKDKDTLSDRAVEVASSREVKTLLLLG